MQGLKLAPFVRYIVPLSAGIVFQVSTNWFSNWLTTIVLPICSLLFCGILLANNIRHRPLYPVFLGMLATVFLFVFGGYLIILHDISKKENFVAKFQSADSYVCVVESEAQLAVKTVKCIVSVQHVRQNTHWVPAKGKVLLYMDTTFARTNHIQYGDVLLIKGLPQETGPPLNPGEFDYKKYLSYVHIFHRDYINGDKAIKTGQDKGNPIIALSIKARNFSGEIIKKYIHAPREVAILSALVVGVRGELDDETLQAYASAGAMHVLSVSGLHVALVFQLLAWMLGFMLHDKVGKWLYYVLSLVLIWGYAFLTGMCPSVMRSVVMFTIILIGQAANKNSNTFNSIAFSAFLLLLYNPLMIMDVGFQLSYLAVLGIVYLQPKLYELIEFKPKWADWVWQITTVSLAAQVVTFPLGILYFHQFPTYFMLSNLVVIPASTVMLYGGIGLFGIAWIPYCPDWYGFLLEKFTWAVNESLVLNQQLPGAVWEGIYIEAWESWLLFGWMALVLLLLERKRFYYLPLVFMLTLISSVQVGKRQLESSQQHNAFVYHIPKKTAIEWVEGTSAIIYTDMDMGKEKGKFRYHIRNNHIRLGIRHVEVIPIDSIGNGSLTRFLSVDYDLFVHKNRTWLIVKRPFAELPTVIQKSNPDQVVFIRNSFKKLVKSKVKLLSGIIYIADGSNASYVLKEANRFFPELYMTAYQGCWQE